MEGLSGKTISASFATGIDRYYLHGNIGFVSDDTLAALQWTIKAGGDTDSNAAIVGAWCGALLGEQGLPANLIDKINDGPFGPSHLRQLACALGDIKFGKTPATPTYFWPTGLGRNIMLIPIILCHTLKRLVLVAPKTNR